MNPVVLARHAMATRFEIVLHGVRPTALRAAAEAAFDEIDRLEEQLSLYRSASELNSVNFRAGFEPIRVEPGLFHLLLKAREIHQITQGAFDITVAPLMRCWGFLGDSGRWPEPDEITQALLCVGMDRVTLDEEARTVRFEHPGVMLDLGSIGKGFALDRAVEALREAGVESALIHGGTSTVCAIGHPPDAEAWNIAIEHPSVAARGGFSLAAGQEAQRTGRDAILAVVPLCDESLSVSAVWGKGFEREGRIYGHILDPRTGVPADGALLACVTSPTAAESDALSTGLLTLGEAGHEILGAARPSSRTFTVVKGADPGSYRTLGRGIAECRLHTGVQ
jgi:thiamine biosynthesis lipoprotein